MSSTAATAIGQSDVRRRGRVGAAGYVTDLPRET
jgi:hypothetical protein